MTISTDKNTLFNLGFDSFNTSTARIKCTNISNLVSLMVKVHDVVRIKFAAICTRFRLFVCFKPIFEFNLVLGLPILAVNPMGSYANLTAATLPTVFRVSMLHVTTIAGKLLGF